MHCLGSVMSKTKDISQYYCGGERYLHGFVLDLTTMLENKLLVRTAEEKLLSSDSE